MRHERTYWSTKLISLTSLNQLLLTERSCFHSLEPVILQKAPRVTPCNLIVHPVPSIHLNLDVRASLDNLFCGLVLVLLKVLDEQATEFGNFFSEAVVSLAPCVSWVQKF
jgi:hypothetical protein